MTCFKYNLYIHSVLLCDMQTLQRDTYKILVGKHEGKKMGNKEIDGRILLE